MSTPTAVADAELARILSDNEDYILSVTKSQAVDLSKEMFQRCVISDSMMDQFSSLDHSRVDPKLQLKYLLRLVTQRIQEDGSVGDKFLSLLESMKEYPLCEYFRQSCFGENSAAKGTDWDYNLTSEDISWLLEELAEVSPKWEMFGIALGLPTYRIKNVRGDDNIKNLWHIIDAWLSGASTAQPSTIGALVQALRSKIVDHSKLAQEIEGKFKSPKKLKMFPSSKITFLLQLSLTITNQSCREVQVEDGKSTLLMVQASHRENVSYQWNKNGQPLADDYIYSGVHDNILVISHAHQGTGGEYTCCAKRDVRDVVSNTMTLTVLYPPEKKTLLDLYSINKHPLDNEWPPVGTETFINLVLAKSSVQTEESSPYSADSVGKTVKIEYRDVFRAYEKAALILVEGRPGSGKTTLIHKVIKDWAQGNALVRANLVFLVSLRFLCGDLQDNTLYSILTKLYTNTEADLENLVSDLEKNNGEGVCFVFDGLDEYHPHLGDKTVIFRLLHKSYLPLAMIIVSSRPGAIARLRQAVVTQHIEVCGFTEDQISEYIDNFPFDTSSDSSLGPAKLKEYLKLHPNVFHMCYLPIHTAIICFVYQTSRGHLPHTQTKIYEEFTRSMILHHLKRINAEIQLYSLKELPEDTREYFSKLCLLAFNMTVEHKQVINERDISFPLCEDTSPHGDWSLGLVTCNRTAQLCGVSTSYMFLHLTLQEYLAAYHIANTEEEEKRKLIEIVKSKSLTEFTSLWTFYFGLEKFESPNDLEIFYDILRANQKPSIRYAFESQQKLVCNEIVKLFGGEIELGNGILPSDIPGLKFVICNTAQAIGELNLTSGIFSEISKLIQEIKDVNFSELKKLTLNDTLYDTATFKNLFVMLQSSAKLSHVEFHFEELCAKTGKYLAATLQYFPNLVHLTVARSYYYALDTSPGLLCVLEKIHCLRKIITLNLSNWIMEDNHCEVLVSSISHLTDMKQLHLEHNDISCYGAILLTSILRRFTKLQILNLCDNCIGLDGAISFFTNTLCHLTRLKVLDVSDNIIDSVGAIRLASALRHHTRLKKLNLSENDIDAGSAIQIITALKNCHKLKRLILNKDSNDIQSSANVQLCDIVASDDSATIDRLVAAVRLHKRKLSLDLGFKNICVIPSFCKI